MSWTEAEQQTLEDLAPSMSAARIAHKLSRTQNSVIGRARRTGVKVFREIGLSEVSAPSNGRKPHAIDVHVGERIRSRRLYLGMTQEYIAGKMGLDFQTVQRYEYGQFRIPASRLAQFAEILEVSVDYFFELLPGAIPPANASKISAIPPENLGFVVSKEWVVFNRSFMKIKSPKQRQQVLDLVKGLADVD